MDYEEMLKLGRTKLPESVIIKERFEIPKVRGHIQGNKTVISNFLNIASVLSREPEHIIKFVLKELAAPGDLTKTALIIGTKVPASRVNEKIRQYAEVYVLCKDCGKPDTKISKEGSITYLICTACGARHPVK
jgi:translation initiation factor 2 subunit 2